LPFITITGGFMIYKTIFWTGFLPVILPSFPLSIFLSIRQNIKLNCESTVEKIELLPDGKYVNVYDLTGKVR